MAAHGHTTAWGTHIGDGRATDAKGWYAQVKTWWAARHHARRETVHPFRADAALDLAVPAHARSITTALCDLGS
jgi:hypothetical protein